MKLKSLLKTTLALTMCYSLANVAVAKEVLSLEFLASTNDEEYDAALVLKNYVETQSDNLEIEIYPGAQLCGNARECLEGLEDGTIDVFAVTAGGLSIIYPEIQALEIPYLLDNNNVAIRLMNSDFTNFLREKVLERSNDSILLMTLMNTGGWRHFSNTQKEVRSPADLQGLKIRSIESQIQQALVQSTGASPTPIPFMEVYTALQTGVVDGTKNSITDLTDMKFQERIKYLTLDGHGYMLGSWLMSKDRFDSLSPEDQKVLVDGFEIMSAAQMGVQLRKEIDAWKAFADAGGKVYAPNDEEKAQFRALSEPIKTWYLEQFGADGQEMLDAYQASLDEAQKEVNDREAQYIGK